MKEKSIDFNAPFPSVRRFHSSISSHANANILSTMNSGVTGVFMVENLMPEPVEVDKDLPFYKLDMKSIPVRDTGDVPFVWERAPGRPKKAPISGEQTTVSIVVPKLPSPCSSSRRMSEQPIVVEDRQGDDREDDDSFSDAPEMLSRTESCSMNCSMLSGMTGMEETTFSCFSSDPQVRDLMMRRFLPAAQAVATASPNSTWRKPPNSELTEKIESGAPRRAVRLPYQIRPKSITRYPPSSNQKGDAGNTDEQDVDDDDTTRTLVFKGCGFLFPKIYSRNRPPSSKSRHAPSLYAPRNPRPSIGTTSARRSNSPFRRSTGGAVPTYRNGSSPFRSRDGGGLRGNHTATCDGYGKIGNRVVYNFESPEKHSNSSRPGNESQPAGPESNVVLSLLPPPPPTPPLPKSPSESWLWRTLSMQFKYRSISTNTSPPDPLLKTIVKTSIVHSGRMRLSEVQAGPLTEFQAVTPPPPPIHYCNTRR